jgi:peptide/nickel transport system substrate-binding protein
VSKLFKKIALGGALAGLMLGMAACSPPAATPPGGSPSTDGGVIRFALYQAPTTFNPFATTNGADGEISSLQFRPLVLTRATEFLPGLAESWEANADASVYTFHLKQFNWSDGQPITVDDVIYTYETCVNPETASATAGQLNAVVGAADFASGAATSIKGLKKIDAHTLEIELAAPNAAFLGTAPTLAIVPKHVFSQIDPAALTGNEAFRSPTVGSGPYVFSKWVTDDQIEFGPNDKSPEKHPLSALYAQFLTSDVARAQLQTGEIDIAQVAPTDVAAVKALDSVDVQLAPGGGVISLYTALETGKLADPLVRQAIMYAINRQAIVDNVLAGNGTVVDTMLFAPDWAVPAGLTRYTYDPEKAKQLLAEAKWDFNTEIKLQIVPGQADRDQVMDIVLGQLTAIGMKVTLAQVQPAELTDLIANHNFDLILTIQSINPSEPGSINPRWSCDGGQNISQYCNPELDRLLKAGVATSDQAERTKIYADANKILNYDLPAMPLYVPNTAWGSAKRVKGFNQPLPLLPLSTFAQDWSVTQ